MIPGLISTKLSGTQPSCRSPAPYTGTIGEQYLASLVGRDACTQLTDGGGARKQACEVITASVRSTLYHRGTISQPEIIAQLWVSCSQATLSNVALQLPYSKADSRPCCLVCLVCLLFLQHDTACPEFCAQPTSGALLDMYSAPKAAMSLSGHLFSRPFLTSWHDVAKGQQRE